MGATPADVTEYKKETANKYWNEVLEIPSFLDNQPKLKTVAAQPVVLKAIAKLYYDTFFGKNEVFNNESNQEKLVTGLKTFDFSHGKFSLEILYNERRSKKRSGIVWPNGLFADRW
ncbi:MAG: hypothetical protein WDO71_22990 [Bacteroidota bacterium]